MNLNKRFCLARGKRESLFFLLYWLTNESSTSNATETEKPMFCSQFTSEWLKSK